MGLRLLDKHGAFQFFSYLFNLEEWAAADQLREDTGVDRQIVKAPVEWHSDHIQVGKRRVQMFSLKTTPEASRPCLFSGLLSLDCDSILCSTWRPKSTAAARSEIDAQEKFISFFKVGILARVMNARDPASLETGAGARAANSSVDDLSEVIRSLDKKAQGEYSLRLLLAANGAEQLRDVVPAVHRIFVDARAQVIEETLGNLSAFYAMFPGNRKFNVFPLWLSEDHHARLSSVFAPHLGHPHSEDLDAEYLNIFETRTRTPFFQDVYVDGVRVMLIIGPTGTGKSVHGNQIIALEQKYGGFSYVFDIGASYESVVELYGGRVDRIGKDGPRVNPFALEPTENNIKFLYSFIKLLLTNGGAELEPEDDDVIHKAVQDMYLLDPENRRLSNLFLPKKLDRYLSKWVGKGIYNAIFDNVEDSLSLSRLQCFDFQGVNNAQYADLIEPQKPYHERLDQIGILRVIHALKIEALQSRQREAVLHVVEDPLIDALANPLRQVTVELFRKEQIGEATIRWVEQVHILYGLVDHVIVFRLQFRPAVGEQELYERVEEFDVAFGGFESKRVHARSVFAHATNAPAVQFDDAFIAAPMSKT